jgi:hypothetical protein
VEIGRFVRVARHRPLRAKLTVDERNEVWHPLGLCWRHVDGPLWSSVVGGGRPVEGHARRPHARAHHTDLSRH